MVLLVATLCVGTAFAQFGGLMTRRITATLRCATSSCFASPPTAEDLHPVLTTGTSRQVAQPARHAGRYRAQFSNWRNVTATNTYGNTSGWLGGVNTDLNVINGYQGDDWSLQPDSFGGYA
jgi:hypothetical protein